MSSDGNSEKPKQEEDRALNRRNMLLGGTTLAAASAIASSGRVHVAQGQELIAAGTGAGRVISLGLCVHVRERKVLLDR
jgi:hypothetical protein